MVVLFVFGVMDRPEDLVVTIPWKGCRKLLLTLFVVVVRRDDATTVWWGGCGGGPVDGSSKVTNFYPPKK